MVNKKSIGKKLKKEATNILIKNAPDIAKKVISESWGTGKKQIQEKLEDVLMEVAVSESVLNTVHDAVDTVYNANRGKVISVLESFESTINDTIDKKTESDSSLRTILKGGLKAVKQAAGNMVGLIDEKIQTISYAKQLAILYGPAVIAIEEESKGWEPIPSYQHKSTGGNYITVAKDISHPWAGALSRKFGAISKFDLNVDLEREHASSQITSKIDVVGDEQSNYNYRKELSRVAGDIFSVTMGKLNEKDYTVFDEEKKVSFPISETDSITFDRTIKIENGDLSITYLGNDSGIKSLTYEKNIISNERGTEK